MTLATRASPSTSSCCALTSIFRASRGRRILVVCAVFVLGMVILLKTQLLGRFLRDKIESRCPLYLVSASTDGDPGTLSPTSSQRSADSIDAGQSFSGAPPRAAARSSYTPAPTVRRRSEGLSSKVLMEAFQPVMSPADKALFLSTLQLLEQTLSSQGVVYFLYGGTLLGAHRHRGIIPWDDDVDVLANFTQVDSIKRCLGSVPGFTLYTGDKHRYKLYPTNGTSIPKKVWKWPYIDVCFFGENASHIFDVYPGLEKVYIYPRRDIFPLQYRPFDSLSLPVPLREDMVLARNYELDTCRPNVYSHRWESAVTKRILTSADCAQLYAFYPFVFRNSSQMPVKETIRRNGTILGEFVFS